MIVCKFGGSSISSSDNIKNVKSILLKKIKEDKIIVVFSAIGKTTDFLIEVGELASKGDDYNEKLNKLLNFHKNIVTNLEIKDKNFFKEFDNLLKIIKDICYGLYYLKDFSSKSSDYLISHGEKLSNLIIYQYLKDNLDNFKVLLEDSTEYIYTDYNYGNAKIIESKTYKNLSKLLEKEYDILVFPGFISKN